MDELRLFEPPADDDIAVEFWPRNKDNNFQYVGNRWISTCLGLRWHTWGTRAKRLKEDF